MKTLNKSNKNIHGKSSTTTIKKENQEPREGNEDENKRLPFFRD